MRAKWGPEVKHAAEVEQLKEKPRSAWQMLPATWKDRSGAQGSHAAELADLRVRTRHNCRRAETHAAEVRFERVACGEAAELKAANSSMQAAAIRHGQNWAALVSCTTFRRPPPKRRPTGNCRTEGGFHAEHAQQCRGSARRLVRDHCGFRSQGGREQQALATKGSRGRED
jgi:hypothetical protein